VYDAYIQFVIYCK